VVSCWASELKAEYRDGRRVIIASHVEHSIPSRELTALCRLPTGSRSYVSKRVSTSFFVNVRTPES